jgi:seryl-tRNA synthetase
MNDIPKELQALLNALPTLTPIQKATAIKALDDMQQKASRIQARISKAADATEEATKQKRAEASTAAEFVKQVTEVMAKVANDVATMVPRIPLQPRANRRTMQK